MRKDKQKKVVIALGVIGFVMILLSLDSLVNKTRVVNPIARDCQAQTNPEVEYNQYDLQGQVLTANIFYEDDNYIFYEDRILKKFNYKKEYIENEKTILHNLSNIIPDNAKIYMMPIPKRIVWEGMQLDETKEYMSFIDELYDIVPESVKLLDPLPKLKKHSDEYLFYRTDDSWTSRGAYYASELLYKKMGLNPVLLEEYDEHLYRRLQGDNKTFSMDLYRNNQEIAEKIASIPDDSSSYYLIHEGMNRAIRTKEYRGTIVNENVVLVSKVRLGNNAVIGNKYLWALAEGGSKSEEKKDKTALLLSDLDGHMIVPFLTPYFEKVYVVNTIYHKYNEEELKMIFKQYNVSDVIIAQDSEDIGDPSKSKFFYGILSKGN
ncbi:DHHW family protein [Alkalibaculum bacchi]|uniref:DHHW family protein n=1 Tax=Alkalibaculum bacchi TaxID=645887 RepID=UPI0026F2D47E|nr:DHHW family protein [Alkalibaculum bacchi]